MPCPPPTWPRPPPRSGVPTEAIADLGDAVARARSVAAEEDAIVITGSLYVAGAALTLLT